MHFISNSQQALGTDYLPCPVFSPEQLRGENMGQRINASILAAAAAASIGHGAQAQTQATPRPWELSLSGGTGFFETPAPYFGVALTRRLGESYISGRITYSSEAESTDPDARVNLPSRTIGGGLGFGHRIGIFTGEIHGFYGGRRGDAVLNEVTNPRTGARVTLSSEPTGRTFSFGGSLSAAIGERVIFTPFVAGDWFSLRTNQLVTVAGRPLGTLASRQENGVLGALGLDVSAPIDRGERLWLGLEASANGTTNGAATDFVGTGERLSGLSQGLNRAGQDGWGQFSGRAALALTDATTLTVSGSRSVGVSGGDATTIGAALSWRF